MTLPLSAGEQMPSVPATHRAKKLAIHIGADASAQVHAMLHRQNLTGLAASQRAFPSGSIGSLGTNTLPTHGNVCIFTGLPINGPDIAGLIDADAAARLFPEYDGAFAGVFWDAQLGRLVVATDCLGMQPLYVRIADGELTIVSETKAMQGDPDLAAWGAVLSIGRPIGARSLMSDLQRVPPASVLTYDCAEHRLDIRRYWEWPEPSGAWCGYDFLDSLERDMCAYVAFGEPGTLLLSGGFDSRLLLFLLKRAGIPADALTVAHQEEYGDADGRLAEAVAKIAGIPHRKVYPRPDFFSTLEYMQYLRASDVGFPSLDLFIAKVAAQIKGPAVWDGLTGFVFRANYQPTGGFTEFLPLRIQGPDSPIWQAAKVVFKPAVVDAMLEGFATDLRTEVARFPQDAYGLARFVMEDRVRNRPAMNPLKVYANWTNAFTPGVSKDFMAHAVIIPPSVKHHDRLYRSLFARLDKRALTIPFLSGGELVTGGWLSAAYYRERLLERADKFRSRHPRMFPGAGHHGPEPSAFLCERLFTGNDRWLDPQIGEKLTSVNAGNYTAWKLLFHWKAWQWVHEGQPGCMPDEMSTVAEAISSDGKRGRGN